MRLNFLALCCSSLFLSFLQQVTSQMVNACGSDNRCGQPAGFRSAMGAWPQSCPQNICCPSWDMAKTKFTNGADCPCCAMYNPTVQPTQKPSSKPTFQPTAPSPQPSANPSNRPSASPTSKPTAAPTALPTQTPSLPPTASPSQRPTLPPTSSPSAPPTPSPSHRPTITPTVKPTAVPTPTPIPSTAPTPDPTAGPTVYGGCTTGPPGYDCKGSWSHRAQTVGPYYCTLCPSTCSTDTCVGNGGTAYYPASCTCTRRSPTSFPTAVPTTASPTLLPSPLPSQRPTANPSKSPTPLPTSLPTSSPTTSPPSPTPTALPTTQQPTAPSAKPTGLGYDMRAESRDGDALCAFYNSLQLPQNQPKLTNWCGAKSGGAYVNGPCTGDKGWRGVTCTVGGRVSALDITIPDLSGQNVTQFGSLSALTSLRLPGTWTFSTIPSSFGLLTGLTELNLNNNWFYGELPSSLGLLTNLQRLVIDYNRFSGPIPASLCSLKKSAVISTTGQFPFKTPGVKGFSCYPACLASYSGFSKESSLPVCLPPTPTPAPSPILRGGAVAAVKEAA